MTNRGIFLFLAVAAVCGINLVGCVSVRETSQRAEERPAPLEQKPSRPPQEIPSLGKYRSLANLYEESEQLQKAHLMWLAVRDLSPDDAEAARKVKEIEGHLRKKAERHFAKGAAYLKDGALPAAQKEFLLVLAHDPEHKEALRALQEMTSDPDYLLYETQEGDTPSRVARKVYGDPGKGFLVAYFSDRSGDEPLKPGTRLRLPILEKDTRKTPERDGKAKAATEPKSFDRAEAERRYNKGVSHFLAHELQQAVKEWEEAIRLYPDHPNAQRDIQKARSLLKKRS